MELWVFEEGLDEELGGDANEIDVGERGDIGGARGFVENGHFTEVFTFAQHDEGNVATAGLDADFGPAGDDEVNGVAPGVFHENGAARRAVIETRVLVKGGEGFGAGVFKEREEVAECLGRHG